MRINRQSDYYREVFGGRVQKVSVDGGFTCPNRDGRVGGGGCVFCVNEAFCPSYCREAGSIAAQLRAGMNFHRWHYRKEPVWLAYFQSYSNTYAPVEALRSRYEEALGVEGVAGLIVSTRPDCIDARVLDLLEELSRRCYVGVEIGIESCYDQTLRLVNRGHDFACTRRAVEAIAARGIDVCGHLIIGLPGESRHEILAEADILNTLPLNSVKLHQLQVIKGSPLAERISDYQMLHFTLDEYVALVSDFLLRLKPGIRIDRVAGEVPRRYLAKPDEGFGGLKASEVTERIFHRAEKMGESGRPVK